MTSNHLLVWVAGRTSPDDLGERPCKSRSSPYQFRRTALFCEQRFSHLHRSYILLAGLNHKPFSLLIFRVTQRAATDRNGISILAHRKSEFLLFPHTVRIRDFF